MSTKITRGTRRHLLRVVKRPEFPMRIVMVGRAKLNDQQREYLRSLAAGMHSFVLPKGCDFEIVGARRLAPAGR